MRMLRALALIALAGWFASWLWPSLAPFAGGADPAGYLWSARLLREGHLSYPIDPIPGLPPGAIGAKAFAALGADVKPGTWVLVPTYPAGLPLHLALAQAVLPEERGVRVVLLLAALGALWLCYRVGREAGLGPLWALGAVVLMAASPLYLFLAVQPMSDVLATLWAEATVFFAWRARRAGAYATLAGASLGLATLVRPTNLLLAVPLVCALPRSRAPVARAIAGGLPFALGLLAYQWAIYGHPLRSGYGDVSSAFSWAFAGPAWRHYATWVPRLGSWLVLLAPGAWWVWRGDRRDWRLVAGAWLLVIFGTYGFYYHTAESWWYLRFVLPAFPPLMIAAVVTLQEVTTAAAARVRPRGLRPAVWLAAAALVAAAARGQVRLPEHDAHRDVKTEERTYRDTIRWMTLTGPVEEPVLMVQLSGAARYYAPAMRMLRFDWLSPEEWTALRAWQARSGQPIRAALFPFERELVEAGEASRLPCAWSARGSFRQVSFWECPAPSTQHPGPRTSTDDR